MGIHTKKAVDEAQGEEKRADDRRDHFMLDINLKCANVQLSCASVRVLGGMEGVNCHIGWWTPLLLCGCLAGWEQALFNERRKLRRPACGVQGVTRLLNEAPNCFLFCTCNREECCELSSNTRSKKSLKKVRLTPVISSGRVLKSTLNSCFGISLLFHLRECWKVMTFSTWAKSCSGNWGSPLTSTSVFPGINVWGQDTEGGNDLVARCLRLTTYCLEHVVRHSAQGQSKENRVQKNHVVL